MKSNVKSNYLEEDKEIKFEAADDDCGPGRPRRKSCMGKADKLKKVQERARRNPKAAKRRSKRNFNRSNRGGGGGGGGGLGKVAGLAILGVGAKAMKNYMDKQ
jgi:hypothetical protein